MTTRRPLLLVVGLLLLLGLLPAQAQDTQPYVLQEESEIWVDGTSNKDDWTVYAPDFSGQLLLVPGTMEVTAADLMVNAAAMESRKSSIMDRLMRRALQADDHEEIRFTATEIVSVPDSEEPMLDVTGDLTIAGQTRTITLRVQRSAEADSRLRFTGQHVVSLPDYGMKPPSAMFGALRTGRDVTVHLNLLAAPTEAPATGD